MIQNHVKSQDLEKTIFLWCDQEISQQKGELEEAYGDLYSSNRKLVEAKNALWGEMALAKKIQTVLLPDRPQIPGYEIAAYMKPADEVGGDYYDVIGNWIVIGDVSGHGVPAGLVMMMAQTAIHQALDTGFSGSPEKILASVNRTIFENIKKLGENKYMTMTLMSVQQNGILYYSGLHQDIMIYRSERRVVDLMETQGMWIGMLDSIDGMIGIEQLTLNPGDTMLLFTDGMTEATDSQGRLFSEEKLRAVFNELGNRQLAEIKAQLLHSLNGYTCQDDVTFLLLRRL